MAIAAAALLTVGVSGARKKYSAHRWVQTGAVVLGLVLAVMWMIGSLIANLRPGLPGDLVRPAFAAATVTRRLAAVLGVVVVVRASLLDGAGRDLRGMAMRVAYLVYMAASA